MKPLLILLIVLTPLLSHAQNSGNGSQAKPLELNWDDLMPEGYDTEALQKKFEKDIERLETLPDDSEEGLKIIERIQAEVDQIPGNAKLDGKWVKMPGFIAPLKIKNAQVKNFLLVPYYGACIHVPPPPVNQTILVELKPKQGIPLHEVDYPFLVTGKLRLQKNNTSIGNAGYHITEATVVIHHDSGWLEPE